MKFTSQALKSALAIAQDLHAASVAEDNTDMAAKWQAEIDRITFDLRVAKASGR